MILFVEFFPDSFCSAAEEIQGCEVQDCAMHFKAYVVR